MGYYGFGIDGLPVLGLDAVKWATLLVLFMLPSFAISDGISSRLNIEETDGSPSVWPYKLKVTTGTLTDNGDGTATLQTGGGGGGGSTSPGGSNGNVQYNNSGSFGGASFFNIHASSSSTTADTVWMNVSIGPVLTDSTGCTWRTTVTTSGSLVTTLLNCPSIVSTFRPCTTGMSLGLLLGITCP